MGVRRAKIVNESGRSFVEIVSWPWETKCHPGCAKLVTIVYGGLLRTGLMLFNFSLYVRVW